MAANAGFDPILEEVADGAAESEAMAAEMLAQVMALPDDVAEAEVQKHLTAIAEFVDPAAIRKVLADAVSAGRASRAGIKALIIHATDTEVASLMSRSAYPVQAFAAAGRDGELVEIFARRCLLALGEEGDLALDCPSVGALVRAEEEIADPKARQALHRVIEVLGQRGAVA